MGLFDIPTADPTTTPASGGLFTLPSTNPPAGTTGFGPDYNFPGTKATPSKAVSDAVASLPPASVAVAPSVNQPASVTPPSSGGGSLWDHISNAVSGAYNDLIKGIDYTIGKNPNAAPSMSFPVGQGLSPELAAAAQKYVTSKPDEGEPKIPIGTAVQYLGDYVTQEQQKKAGLTPTTNVSPEDAMAAFDAISSPVIGTAGGDLSDSVGARATNTTLEQLAAEKDPAKISNALRMIYNVPADVAGDVAIPLSKANTVDEVKAVLRSYPAPAGSEAAAEATGGANTSNTVKMEKGPDGVYRPTNAPSSATEPSTAPQSFTDIAERIKTPKTPVSNPDVADQFLKIAYQSHTPTPAISSKSIKSLDANQPPPSDAYDILNKKLHDIQNTLGVKQSDLPPNAPLGKILTELNSSAPLGEQEDHLTDIMDGLKAKGYTKIVNGPAFAKITPNSSSVPEKPDNSTKVNLTGPNFGVDGPLFSAQTGLSKFGPPSGGLGQSLYSKINPTDLPKIGLLTDASENIKVRRDAGNIMRILSGKTPDDAKVPALIALQKNLESKGTKEGTILEGILNDIVPSATSKESSQVEPKKTTKTTDINKLRQQLDRAQQSLDAAEANPEAHQMAYGGDKRPEYRARIKDLAQRIAEAKNPPFETGNALVDARKALEAVQKRVGLPETDIGKLNRQLAVDEATLEFHKENPGAKDLYGRDITKQYEKDVTQTKEKIKKAKRTLLDSVKKIPVSENAPAGLEYPEDLAQRAALLAQERELILDDPRQQLIPYIATSGEFKGTLPEITGQTPAELKGGKSYGKTKNPKVLQYVQKGDEINQEIFGAGATYATAPDPEEVKSSFEDYLQQIADWKVNARELKADQAAFIAQAKDEAKIDKFSFESAEKANYEHTKQEALDKRRAALEAAQAKINAEVAKAQDRRNRLAAEFTKPPVVKKFNTLNPLKSQDAETKKIYQAFQAKMNEAKNIGLKYTGKMPEIDALGSKAFELYESGYLPKAQTDEIKDLFEKFFDYAQKNGFEDLHFVPNYLPHVYKNPEMFESAVQKALKEKGLTQDEIQRYLNGKKLNPDLSTKLKLNPFFSKERFFPSYAEAATYGLEPKFDKMSQLIEHYERQLLQTSAARTFIENLSDTGKIEPEQTAPRDWRHIKYGPEGLRGYKAPPILAQFLDNFFQGHADMGNLDRFAVGLSKVSRFAQRMALSTGIPFTSIDPFAVGITIKEMVRGNLKAISSLIKSNSNEATIKSLQKDYKYLEMMARNGIQFRTLTGTLPANYENAKTKWAKLVQGVKEDPKDPDSYTPFFQIVGQGLGKVWGQKTFDSFIPLLNVQVFKGAYHAALDAGMPDEQAQSLAAGQTKTVMGLMNDVGRSKLTGDYISSVMYAPVYREAMLNVLWNTAKTADPRTWKNPMYKFNRQLFAGLAVAFAAYALLNKKLNGQWMWENPAGHETDLRIPLPNGTIIYTPFMPSFMTIPRLLFATGKAAIAGDPATAFHQFGGTLSSVVSMTLNVLTNQNYFGAAIYKATDTPAQKAAKIGAYIGLEFNHPYVKALVAQIQSGSTPTPLYQSVVSAIQFPLKFSTVAKEQTNDVFTAIANQATAQAQGNLAAEAEWARLKGVAATSKADAKTQFDNLLKSNPTLAAQVSKIATQEAQGITATDRAMLLLGVKNGARANLIYQEVNKLPAAQRGAYVSDLIDKKIVTQAVSDQLAQMVKNGGQPISTGNNDNGTAIFEGHPTYYGGSSGPVASVILGGNSDDGTIAGYNINHEPIYARNTQLEASRKVELYNQDPYWKNNGISIHDTQFDHIVPLEAGGTNTENNIQLISTAADQANQAFEDYLGAQYKNGKISRADAAKASIDYKINKTVSLTDVENGKY